MEPIVRTKIVFITWSVWPELAKFGHFDVIF